MWNISKVVQDYYSKCNVLPIHETDLDWENALREAEEEEFDLLSDLQEYLQLVKGQLLQVLPSRFISYVENEKLNQPTLPVDVREDYLQWVRDRENEFQNILNAAYEQTQNTLSSLSEAIQEVFAGSLHDSRIERIERDHDTLHLTLNTDGGFSRMALIQFSYQQITKEESEFPLREGQWIVYYELQKTDEGFAFRVLFDDEEWTVHMKNLDAIFYFRPLPYATLRDEGKLNGTSFEEYLSELNPNNRYWINTPTGTTAIQAFSEKKVILENGKLEIASDEIVITLDNHRSTYVLTRYNPIKFVYTDVYEDPYARFSESVPKEELEEAALGDDLNLSVRAWNTMYANPQALAGVINRVLDKMDLTEENEMIICIYTNHFNKEGILSEEILRKFQRFIDSD